MPTSAELERAFYLQGFWSGQPRLPIESIKEAAHLNPYLKPVTQFLKTAPLNDFPQFLASCVAQVRVIGKEPFEGDRALQLFAIASRHFLADPDNRNRSSFPVIASGEFWKRLTKQLVTSEIVSSKADWTSSALTAVAFLNPNARVTPVHGPADSRYFCRSLGQDRYSVQFDALGMAGMGPKAANALLLHEFMHAINDTFRMQSRIPDLMKAKGKSQIEKVAGDINAYEDEAVNAAAMRVFGRGREDMHALYDGWILWNSHSLMQNYSIENEVFVTTMARAVDFPTLPFKPSSRCRKFLEDHSGLIDRLVGPECLPINDKDVLDRDLLTSRREQYWDRRAETIQEIFDALKDYRDEPPPQQQPQQGQQGEPQQQQEGEGQGEPQESQGAGEGQSEPQQGGGGESSGKSDPSQKSQKSDKKDSKKQSGDEKKQEGQQSGSGGEPPKDKSEEKSQGGGAGDEKDPGEEKKEKGEGAGGGKDAKEKGDEKGDKDGAGSGAGDKKKEEEKKDGQSAGAGDDKKPGEKDGEDKADGDGKGEDKDGKPKADKGDGKGDDKGDKSEEGKKPGEDQGKGAGGQSGEEAKAAPDEPTDFGDIGKSGAQNDPIPEPKKILIGGNDAGGDSEPGGYWAEMQPEVTLDEDENVTAVQLDAKRVEFSRSGRDPLREVERKHGSIISHGSLLFRKLRSNADQHVKHRPKMVESGNDLSIQGLIGRRMDRNHTAIFSSPREMLVTNASVFAFMLDVSGSMLSPASEAGENGKPRPKITVVTEMVAASLLAVERAGYRTMLGAFGTIGALIYGPDEPMQVKEQKLSRCVQLGKEIADGSNTGHYSPPNGRLLSQYLTSGSDAACGSTSLLGATASAIAGVAKARTNKPGTFHALVFTDGQFNHGLPEGMTMQAAIPQVTWSVFCYPTKSGNVDGIFGAENVRAVKLDETFMGDIFGCFRASIDKAGGFAKASKLQDEFSATLREAKHLARDNPVNTWQK